METKIIKVTDKGQISIPIEIRKAVGINSGDDLVIVHDNGKICMKKIKKANFNDLLKHSEIVAEKLWDNKDDEVWDSI
jgi:antitoxin PrlF